MTRRNRGPGTAHQPSALNARGRARCARRAAVLLLSVLLLPLPWRAAAASVSPGTAWRLDGRLQAGDRTLDPPGETLWLAAGRPQTLAERVAEVLGAGGRSSALTGSSAPASPADAARNASAAVQDLSGAGHADIRISLSVGPFDLGGAGERLGLGDSHGLAIAVALLRDGGHLDLGGETVAATGRIDPDGNVHPVGGIAPKSRAAVRAGATLLLVPTAQAAEARTAIGGSGTRVLGVADLHTLLPEGAPAAPAGR